MNTEQLEIIRIWFDDYVHSLFGADGLPGCIVLKIEHTKRVAENARQIAEELGWDQASVVVAETLGWLHDVGRFTQFVEFGHFHDATSVNHGTCGCCIVREAGILSILSEETRSCLLESIQHHNARIIPEETTEDCLPFLKLIRDADKLDIYRVVLEHLQQDGFLELKNMWPHVDLDGPISPKVLESAQKKKNGSVVDIQSLADFLLLQIGWVYEIYYAPTRKRMAERGILDDIGRYLPDDPRVSDVLKQARTLISSH